MNAHRRHRSVILWIVLLATALVGHAQDASSPTLQVSELGGYGAHLADAEGMSLYLYAKDEENVSNCVGGCTRNWPPALVDGELEIGDGVDAELVDQIEREDGTMQLTYAGHPLYRYARDAGPEDTNGQALGDAFFLVSAAGERVTEAVAEEKTDIGDELYAAYMDEGARGFASHCAVCHGVDGQGKIGPKLGDNERLGDTSFFLGRILNGFTDHGMPAFRDQLSDRAIAAIATFARNSWSNEFGPVTEEEVMNRR